MRPIILLLAVLIFGCGTPCSFGQAEVKAPAPEIESLEEKIKKLDAADKSVEAAGYRKLLELRKKIGATKAASAEFEERLNSIPDELAEAREALAAMATGSDPEEVDGGAPKPVELLGQESRQAKADYAAATSKRESIEGETGRRRDRMDMIPTQIAESKSQLKEIEEELEAGASGEVDGLVLLAQKELLEESLKLFEIEKSYDRAASALLVAERDVAVRHAQLLGKLATAAERRLDARRTEMAEQAAERATITADRTLPPELARIAAENAKIAMLRSGDDGLSGKIAAANRKLAAERAELARVDGNHAEAERQVQLFESAGLRLGKATGDVLLREKIELPKIEEIQVEVRRSLEEWTAARLETVRWENRRRDEASDLEGVIAQLVARVGEDEAATVRQIVTAKRTTLDDLIRDSRTYEHVLGDTLNLQRSLITKVQEYSDFIEERILWIRSGEPLHRADYSMGAAAVRRLFSAHEWGRFAGQLTGDLRHSFLIWMIFCSGLLFLLLHRGRCKRALVEVGNQAAKRNCRSFRPTLMALLYTLLIAAPVPLVIAFLYWRSVEVALMGSWTEMICQALYAITLPITAMAFARGLSRPNGLLQRHLGLGADQAKMLFKGFTWMMLLIMPLAFLREGFIALGFYSGSRVCYIISMLVLAGFALVVLRPSRGLMSTQKDSLWHRFAYPVYLFIFGIALALGVAAYLGYFYTILELTWRLNYSVWMTLMVLLIAAIVGRLLVISRRRVAFDQRLASFKAAQAERQRAATDVVDPQVPNLAEIEADLVDITKVKAQTQSLMRMAAIMAIVLSLWGVWVEVAPSLKVLDGVRLWSSAASQPAASDRSEIPSLLGSSSGDQPNGSPGSGVMGRGKAKDNFVSLADLGLAILTVFLTYFAACNVPGLLEITLLKRLRLNPGGSYTVTTLVRYVIILVGIITAFAYIDITWSKVQWIAAAITLGIGFGLQEVIANFVAGLILLFERPIRLGDFVTVGGVNGTVTQIRIRATTIRDRSNKELLVPNKEFITGQLVNWTLTDVVLRLEIPVGIAYGSDTELARDLLLKVGREHKSTLPEPAPSVVFSAFGASSLDFELRAFVRGADDLILASSEIHFAIDKTFREAGIEIAFPQRDLHIRSMPEGLLPDSGEPGKPATPPV